MTSTQDEPYDVVLAPAARRALSRKLPAAAAFAAWEFIRGPLSQRPHVVGEPLRYQIEGRWRARRGEYRIVYRIEEGTRAVYVLDVDHRREVYRS